jgi:Metal-dependent hydrolases of the beta-lactamase superfamily I
MNLHFLGTGAADWDITNPETTVDFRRFSSVLIDGNLLLDCGPCLYEFADSFECPDLYKNVKTILLTHSHGDHFQPDTLKKLASEKPVFLYGDKAVKQLVDDIDSLSFVPIELFETRTLGEYHITAVPANHSVPNIGEKPRHYIIEKEDQCLFYGLDGAWLLKETVAELKKHQFDGMIFDATIGEVKGDYRIFEHNNLHMVEEMKLTIDALDIMKKNGRFIISHMARTLHTDHMTLSERVKSNGITVAYDNLILKL